MQDELRSTITCVTILALMTALSVSCEHYEVLAVGVASVEVEPPSQTVPRGETRFFTVRAEDGEGRELHGREVVWSTMDETVAVVDANGRVSGVGIGTTEVIAEVEGQTGRATVNVTRPAVKAVAVTPATVSLRPGSGTTLHATVTGSDDSVLTDRQVSWRSSKPGVAQVDDAGNVSALTVGNATITASAEGVEGTAEVLIALERVTKVTVSPAASVLDVTDAILLSAQLEGEDGSDLTNAGRVVTWSGSSPDVALGGPGTTITATALAATCAVGETACTVTVIATSEGVSGTATITVRKRAARVTVTPPSATLDPGQSVDLEATVEAADGTDLTSSHVITWTRSSSDIVLNGTTGPDLRATAAAATCAVGQVSCAVTITAAAGGASGVATLVVRKRASRVTVTPSAATLDVGGALSLDAAVVADDGTTLPSGGAITWSTASPDVTLAVAGNTASVTAKGATCPPPAASCTATITASAPGLPPGTAVLTVRKPVASLQIQPASPLNLVAGAAQGLSVAVFAADGSPITDRTVTWTSASAGIASVTAANPLGLSANLTTPALPACVGDPCTTSVVATVQGIADTLVVNVAKQIAKITITLSNGPVMSFLFAGTQTATATVEAADGTVLARPVTWSVSAGAPFSVNPVMGSSTTVTVNGVGQGTLRATSGGVTATVQITVTV